MFYVSCTWEGVFNILRFPSLTNSTFTALCPGPENGLQLLRGYVETHNNFTYTEVTDDSVRATE